MNEKNTIRTYKNKILVFLNKSGKKPVQFKELAAKCRSKKSGQKEFAQAMQELTETGMIFERKRGFVLSAILGYFPAKISRINKTFGFARRNDDNSEIFIPGKFLMGALPDDDVLIRLIPSRTGSPEGEVVAVLKENNQRISGMVVEYDGEFYIRPDTMSNNHIKLVRQGNVVYRAGDKILAEIIKRGSRHSEHIARALLSFGSSDMAASCAAAILTMHGIETAFPEKVERDADKIAEAGISAEDMKNRLDLRDMPVFTIDSAESKDLDDAVSIVKIKNGYMLGVHIADVSNYVKGNSDLDKEALKRGTSVYYADKVVPMLPKSLSNGICSLNPDEDRLTFSAIMKISSDGKLLEYTFRKSVIRSRVKGVYSEINKILDNTADDSIKDKYAEVTDEIFLMKELADILTAGKEKRGAPQIETSESKIIIGENGLCCDVVPRTRGASEIIIEEFMLMANESAAKLAKEKNIPFVYRVHESPDESRIDNLKQVLDRMNIEYPDFTNPKPAHFSKILKDSYESSAYPVVNMMVLRAMAKAKYMNKPLGHFGLALDDYAHFTSPIRRYPDLAIHRILSDLIDGKDGDWLTKRYESFSVNASERSTNAEVKAMTVERECEDCYKAEYMQSKTGEEFDGIITSVSEFGFYVELANTVEGLVHVNSMPECRFDYDGMICLTDEITKTTFMTGDRVRVCCVRADVNSGNVDFNFVKKL
ncbi:MAG: ribonuclease R [Oscillospiraceae bacterium]